MKKKLNIFFTLFGGIPIVLLLMNIFFPAILPANPEDMTEEKSERFIKNDENESENSKTNQEEIHLLRQEIVKLRDEFIKYQSHTFNYLSLKKVKNEELSLLLEALLEKCDVLLAKLDFFDLIITKKINEKQEENNLFAEFLVYKKKIKCFLKCKKEIEIRLFLLKLASKNIVSITNDDFFYKSNLSRNLFFYYGLSILKELYLMIFESNFNFCDDLHFDGKEECLIEEKVILLFEKKRDVFMKLISLNLTEGRSDQSLKKLIFSTAISFKFIEQIRIIYELFKKGLLERNGDLSYFENAQRYVLIALSQLEEEKRDVCGERILLQRFNAFLSYKIIGRQENNMIAAIISREADNKKLEEILLLYDVIKKQVKDFIGSLTLSKQEVIEDFWFLFYKFRHVIRLYLKWKVNIESDFYDFSQDAIPIYCKWQKFEKKDFAAFFLNLINSISFAEMKYLKLARESITGKIFSTCFCGYCGFKKERKKREFLFVLSLMNYMKSIVEGLMKLEGYRLPDFAKGKVGIDFLSRVEIFIEKLGRGFQRVEEEYLVNLCVNDKGVHVEGENKNVISEGSIIKRLAYNILGKILQ